MKWTAHIDGGPRRVNHAAVCVDGKIFSFGGYCSSEDFNDWGPIPVHVLNTYTLRWTKIKIKHNKHTPFQRYGHTTVAYGQKVYMWGGRNNTVACDKISCFNTKTQRWSTPSVTGMVPYAKDGHSSCIIGNKMYVFGGYEYVSNQYSQEVYFLDLDTMKWGVLDVRGSPPSHRDFHTALPYNNRMYIFGGRGDLNDQWNSAEELYCSQVYYLDVDKEEWVIPNPSGTPPEGRRSHSAWLHEGCMYIFGGFNGKSTKTHYNDLHRYNIALNTWECVLPTGIPPTKRRRQVCLPYNDKMFLFGGTSPHPELYKTEGETEESERLIDNGDLHVLDYRPTLRTLCILAVAEHQLDRSELPEEVAWDIQMMTVPNSISVIKPVKQSG